ncbi:hypothetical protein VTI74DRAFT_2887 [Chaetomium olivicolor]
MAPINPELQEVQENVKNVIQDLFQILVQTSNYDSAGRPSREPLAQDLITLDASLRAVHTSATTTLLSPRTTTTTSSSSSSSHPFARHNPNPTNDRGIPEPLIEYVENGRNPDIYTREFVELVRRMNQYARGKMHAFRDFRDILAQGMSGAMPEVREDVKRVVEATGGFTERTGEEEGVTKGDDGVGELAQGVGGNVHAGQGLGGQ